MSHSFQVITNCSKAVVLGQDLLSIDKIVVNMQNLSFQLDENSIPVASVNPHTLKLVDVTVSTTMVVPALSETVISAKHVLYHAGLQPNGYTSVFEPHYCENSNVGFAWTVKKEVKALIYLKVVNPSADDISLHCVTPIGTFHSISESDQDGFVITDKSVNNVNIQNVLVPVKHQCPSQPVCQISLTLLSSLKYSMHKIY